MIHVPVTGFYAAILSVLILFFAYRIVRLRRKHRVDVGAGESKDLEVAIRVHGNAIEYIPISLILLACYELNNGVFWVCHGFGAALLLGRLLHFQGFGLHRGISFGRFYGTALTWIVIIGLATLNILPSVMLWG